MPQEEEKSGTKNRCFLGNLECKTPLLRGDEPDHTEPIQVEGIYGYSENVMVPLLRATN